MKNTLIYLYIGALFVLMLLCVVLSVYYFNGLTGIFVFLGIFACIALIIIAPQPSKS